VEGAARQEVRGGRLERRLAARLGVPLVLTFTDNTHTMISFTRARAAWRLRLHGMFDGAPDEVVEALGAWLGRADRRASERIDAYIHACRSQVRRREARARRVRLGRVVLAPKPLQG
jgi:hypothetical protein